MADQNHERAVEQYNGIIDTQLAEIARLKAECQARQAENSVLAVECDSLKAEVDRLQSIHSIDSIGIEQLKAEVERLTADIQMEKENEDRLVREWQRANNEVYGLKTQVAALIDNQTSLKAEVERLTGELGELEGIRSYLKWNGLQADLKDWLDWRSGKNGSEIPFPKDYLPPKQ